MFFLNEQRRLMGLELRYEADLSATYAEYALDELHGALSDWVHRNSSAAKKALFRKHSALPTKQQQALQAVVNAAVRKHHGGGKVLLYRRMKPGQSPNDMGGMSLTTEKPRVSAHTFEVVASDILLHWAVSDTPLNSKAFGHEREVILHAHAKPRLIREP